MKLQVRIFLAFVLVFAIATAGNFSRRVRGAGDQPAVQTDQAGTALREGRRLLKRGKSDQALGQLQTALSLYTAAKNRKGIAAAQNELGDLYLRQGQNKTALNHYKLAYDALSGVVVQEQKNTAAAETAASIVPSNKAGQAVDTAASASDTSFNAKLLLAKIGDTNYQLGQYAPAASSYSLMSPKKPESAAKKAGGMFAKLAPSIVVGNATNSATLGSAAGAVGGALVAKNELEQYRIAIVYMTYELGMGRIAFAQNDLDTARTHFQNAADAGKSALPGIANLGQTRRFRAAAHTNLADVALKQLDYKNAFKLYDQAAKGAKDDKRLDLMWPAQLGMGRSQWALADQEKDPKKAGKLRETALSSFQDAITTVETLRAGSLRADESRTIFLSTTKDVFDDATSAYAQMALLTASPAGGNAESLSGKALEYAAAAFKINEQSRARSLLDLLSETNASVTEGIPPALLKRKQDNLDKQQEIAEQLTGISLSPDADKKKPSDLEDDLEKLQTEFEEIENQIRTASPRYASLTSSEPVSLADVQSGVLDDQTALLEYGLGKDASYLWAITKSGVSLYKLPSRTAIDKLATDLRAQLIPAKLQRRIVGIDVMAENQRGLGISATPFAEDAAGFAAASNALYKAVLEPAAAGIGDKRLLIVADGALNYVPFEALVKSSETADYSSLPYLIKSNEIIYAPSASVVRVIRQQNANRDARAMLIVADPVFNSNDARAKGTGAAAPTADTRGLGIESALTDVSGSDAVADTTGKMQGLPLARLAGTRTEAEQIAKLAKASGTQADTWLDLDASEDNIDSRDVTKYRVLHIATHGLLNAERPQFTGVVLSLVGNKTEDGFLRTDEVFNLRLGSPLVMLSACETGLGKENRGEGVMGLTRAFMYAGAPTVGVTLWSVADKSTADLMTGFYKRFLATPNSSPSAAMREAQLEMIAGKKYSAPFYWAPFVLVGDWH